MNRALLWTAVLFAPAWLSCASLSPAEVAPPLPAGCTEVSGSSLTLTVDADANVDEPCVRVRSGQTKVVWQAAPELRLWVAFQRGAAPAPPRDPGCVGRECALSRNKVVGDGDYKYTVVVVRRDGSVASVDPRLIIWP